MVNVIGIGSDWGADALGIETIRDLRACNVWQRRFGARVALHVCRAPARELLALLADGRPAVIIDAAEAGIAPGEILRLPAEALPRRHPALAGHGVDLADVLALGRALGALAAPVTVLAMQISEPETRPDADAFKRMRKALEREVVNLLTGCQCQRERGSSDDTGSATTSCSAEALKR